ncbi:late embryogenesis abundant protein At1g64065 [Cynara cardunculus var. scolymus]|uniref:late embryogenesis abundant protein At1g64065 n=1 Tax=Cynara cardunculus var. scolymus TaxID=59895 RepID=UPI000D631419|nr:late embryogenesis abundant protein At1g64065 [Cynara cardunculus var. scolymus]
MDEREQVRPLAPANDEEPILEKTTLQRRNHVIKWCGYMVTVVILLLVLLVILIFTVFKIKEPEIRMNSVMVDRSFNLINGTIPQPGTNMSLIADISVKNPNFASFRYKNTTTSLYYHGTVVGAARGPPGRSKARRTTRMNITVDIMVDSILGNPNLESDLGRGLLTMSSYTRVGGRVKILTFINKYVTVRMNCTMKVNITSRAIEDQKCTRKVKL